MQDHAPLEYPGLKDVEGNNTCIFIIITVEEAEVQIEWEMNLPTGAEVKRGYCKSCINFAQMHCSAFSACLLPVVRWVSTKGPCFIIVYLYNKEFKDSLKPLDMKVQS